MDPLAKSGSRAGGVTLGLVPECDDRRTEKRAVLRDGIVTGCAGVFAGKGIYYNVDFPAF